MKTPRPPKETQSPSLLPCEVELVRLLARIAAERDYRAFVELGELPQAVPAKDSRHD